MSELMTAEELEQVDIPGKATELIRGHLVVREPPSTYHGCIASNLNLVVAMHVRAHDLGAVFGQDTGFKITSDPDTVRAADLAFVARQRVGLIGRRGYAALAPDFVAEILSPDDRPGEVLEKIGEWLEAGVRLVWVIDPDAEMARVYRADGSLRIVEAHAALDGDDVMPGLMCQLSDILSVGRIRRDAES